VIEGAAGPLDPIERPRSLSTALADRIRELIVTGRFALGEQLSESTIAEQLGVSRTPVREAFARLQAERLVEVKPQRGTFVFRYDATELREICELREVLETGALRLALRGERAALAERLSAQLDAAEQAVAEGARAYQPFDTAFHETLVAASNNRELMEAYARVSGRIRAIRYRLTRTAAQVTGSQRDHRDVVSAMRAGADAEAAALLGRHVHNGYRFFMERMSQANAASEIDAA
jgi:DNA-binding GntR family transcriptional regulator